MHSEIPPLFANITRLFKYSPGKETRFVLKETETTPQGSDKSSINTPLMHELDKLHTVIRYAQRTSNYIESLLPLLRQGNMDKHALSIEKRRIMALESQANELNPLVPNTATTQTNELFISSCIDENLLIISQLYRLPDNKDLIVRHFSIEGDVPIPAMLVYMKGIADAATINSSILKPLMTLPHNTQSINQQPNLDYILSRFLPDRAVTKATSFRLIEQHINSGDAALFFEGMKEAALAEVGNREHRGVDRPVIEQSVRGSQEAFVEVLGVNTSLIRAALRSSDLITETFTVGARSQRTCAIMYLRTVVNDSLVAEVKRRIQRLELDFVDSTAAIEQMIVDHPNIPFPQTLSTERPDRVAVHLAEGRIALLFDGSPFVNILPVTVWTMIHFPEDHCFNPIYATFIRLLRIFGAFLSLLLPSLYLAVSTFHQETIPTDLLLSIISARSQVPFPTTVEILIMDVSYELIRESGLRIPGILGPAIGILGAITLGQAAVAAKIVSPIMVIIIATAGLSSFIIPEYRFAVALRLFRYGFFFLAAFLGLVGIATGLLCLLYLLCYIKSFGVPFVAPLGPTTNISPDIIIRGPIYSQEKRPDVLNTKDQTRQPEISRKWIQEDDNGE